MAQRFGQPVLVDNKPGAAGLLAGDIVAKAPADGMTALLGTTSSMVTNKYLYKKTPYDPLTDLTPLVRVCLAPIALVVTADTPAQNLQEFMAWIHPQKGKLSYGSYGIGSHGQLACTTLSEVTGSDMSHVAYKGEATMVQDLLGGQIKIGMGSLLSLKTHIDSGKLRALAVTGPRRVPLLPQVPTFSEAGYPQDALYLVGWLAIAGPKGLQVDVARQWAQAANHAVLNRDNQARIIAAGFVPVKNDTPNTFGQPWTQEAPLWGSLLQAAGVQPN